MTNRRLGVVAMGVGEVAIEDGSGGRWFEVVV